MLEEIQFMKASNCADFEAQVAKRTVLAILVCLGNQLKSTPSGVAHIFR